MTEQVGSNLQQFKQTQLEFAAYIRNPKKQPAPSGIEHRRMQIYAKLFFNNVRNFLESTFPVAKSSLESSVWLQLCRDFFDRHGSESPYFNEISQEFLTFLSTSADTNANLDLPPYLLELCHYEWVELALDLQAEDLRAVPNETQFGEDIGLSEEARCLVYEYPVHQIGPGFQPKDKSTTYLVVYRNEHFQVRFIESNPATHRFLGLLDEMSVADALARVSAELQEGGHEVNTQKILTQGRETLTEFARLGIIRLR